MRPNTLTEEINFIPSQDSLIKRRSSIAIGITQVEGKMPSFEIVLSL